MLSPTLREYVLGASLSDTTATTRMGRRRKR